jgi:hypothetical protein
MHLPDNMVDAMLNRQEELANTIAKAAACMTEKEEKEEKEKDAGVELEASASLLDDIFAGVIASDTKKGAKSLSGLVKKEASDSNSDPLAGIWKTDPDISNLF